jgi:thiol:disulfide interchange protein DsbD
MSFFEMNRRGLWLAMALIPALWAGPVAGAVVRQPHVEAELVSEVASVRAGEPFHVAVRLKMEEHWHTYWKNPGDSGLATSLEWTLPEGWSAGPIVWPVPQTVEVGGLVSYAYEGEVFLLTEIRPGVVPSSGRVVLEVAADWLVCKEICLPGSARLTLVLPVGEGPVRPSGWAEAFARVRAELPVAAPEGAVRVVRSGGEWEIRSVGLVPEHFFAETEQAVAYNRPQILRDGVLRVSASEEAGVERMRGVLTGRSPEGRPQAWEVDVPVELAPVGGVGGADSFVVVLLGAFLGGLILNLMPCVFPVLGIKIMGLVRQAGDDRRTVAAHGLAYTAGVVVSFLVLAGVLLALRSGGAQLGWGFQLQNAAFVYVLALVLLLFGLNMSGVFEVGGSLVGAGSKGPGGMTGSFLSGILATVVATPCAAPFLATALGAALVLPPVPSLVLFTAMGLGLALPYLLLSFFPSLASRLPRPGAWMESFKQGLSFLLYAAAVYLVWVLAAQVEGDRLLAALFGMVLVASAAWVYGRWCAPVRSGVVRLAGLLVAGLILAGGVVYGWPRAERGGVEWEAWSPEAVERHRAAGRPVYVDFTARWCATCQVNKKVVFGSAEVRREFAARKVVLLQADWTRKDPAITAELARFGRSAVPFNLFYLPGRSEPVVLPEVLTPGVVLDILKNGVK